MSRMSELAVRNVLKDARLSGLHFKLNESEEGQRGGSGQISNS